jgi:glycosyltransferase involved in cell wall biosynthesis
MLSIFTPTHNPLFINRLAKSLIDQTHQDFEWVIVPNGDCRPEDISLPVYGNLISKVRIIPYTGLTQNIGEIKKFACENSLGNVLVEVDHDDELTPDCLEELTATFADDKVDFVYSNCCEILNDQPYTYSDIYGWKYRSFQWKGKDLLETLAFAPDPAAFSKIWYAPNHVRAWRRSFYVGIGGHDASMEVCDDHDIVCRSYIHGNVKHIDKCLYVYHYTGMNTSKGEKNELIQNMTLGLHDKYIYQMVEKWSDMNGLRKIDLCGGFDSPLNYESIDKFGGDITADLEDPWPIEDGTVGVFRAHDALEHMKDQIHVMKEIYRCLAPKGWLLSLTPSSDQRGAFQDPTHKSFWNSNSFFYYCKEQQARYINTPVKMQLNRIKNFYPSDWHSLHQILYVKADLYKFDPKERTCGLIEI